MQEYESLNSYRVAFKIFFFTWFEFPLGRSNFWEMTITLMIQHFLHDFEYQSWFLPMYSYTNSCIVIGSLCIVVILLTVMIPALYYYHKGKLRCCPDKTDNETTSISNWNFPSSFVLSSSSSSWKMNLVYSHICSIWG